jgi:hypothetical protein
MFEAGADSPMDELVPLIRLVVGGIDVQDLDVPRAARVVEQCAEAERVLAALRVAAAATLKNKTIWRREGFRSAAHWMAAKTGTAVGPATEALDMADQLACLPDRGRGIPGRAAVGGAGGGDHRCRFRSTGGAGSAAGGGGKLSLQGLREECRRVKAAVIVDEDDRYRRIHKARRLRGWVDRHQVGHLSATMTADQLAVIMNEIHGRGADIMADAIRGGWVESREAHLVDALVDMALPDSAAPSWPDSMIHVVVDYDALVRGHTVAGEPCEIPGTGRSRRISVVRWRSAIPSASCRTATSAGTSRSITPRATTGPVSPNSTNWPDSADGTTIRRATSATPTGAGRGRGNGSLRKTATRTSPPCGRSSRAPADVEKMASVAKSSSPFLRSGGRCDWCAPMNIQADLASGSGPVHHGHHPGERHGRLHLAAGPPRRGTGRRAAPGSR